MFVRFFLFFRVNPSFLMHLVFIEYVPPLDLIVKITRIAKKHYLNLPVKRYRIYIDNLYPKQLFDTFCSHITSCGA